MSVIWHDLECGSYAEDLPLWHELAQRQRGSVLEIGAGTGRVTLELARAGHQVTALDNDHELLAALADRAHGLPVEIQRADARDFWLARRFALCIVPMQTVQLFGGRDGRLSFLRCARAHLEPGGLVAITLASGLETYDCQEEEVSLVPDMTEVDGVVYCSQPSSISSHQDRFILVRRREKVDREGRRSMWEDAIELDQLTPAELAREARAIGLRQTGRRNIAATAEYAGSEVVIIGA